jgi:hypothetical protein
MAGSEENTPYKDDITYRMAFVRSGRGMRQSGLQVVFQTIARFKAILTALNNGPLRLAEIVIIRVN